MSPLFNESSRVFTSMSPLVYSSCPGHRDGPFKFFKVQKCAGKRTYLVIYARVCLCIPDSGAVKPTALRAYRKLSWPIKYRDSVVVTA